MLRSPRRSLRLNPPVRPTPPSHGSVLRYGWLHGAVWHCRSRAFGRTDQALSGCRRRRDRAVRRLRRQIHGRGVLAYFGFPRAFEDAAERGVRAALAIVAEVEHRAPGRGAPSARIGIATGLVVVGEIIGTGTAQERTIVGETPNLAARLQALAAPDTILLSEATQNLLGGLFELESTGEHELKGFSRPVPAWRVRGEASVESRFAAIRTGGNLPLIGRTHEMGLLLERWRLARRARAKSSR